MYTDFLRLNTNCLCVHSTSFFFFFERKLIFNSFNDKCVFRRCLAWDRDGGRWRWWIVNAEQKKNLILIKPFYLSKCDYLQADGVQSNRTELDRIMYFFLCLNSWLNKSNFSFKRVQFKCFYERMKAFEKNSIYFQNRPFHISKGGSKLQI